MNDAKNLTDVAPRDRAGAASRAWTIVGASIAALLLAIVVAGVVAIIQNARVNEITARALTFDIEVEDEGDDLRAAVLELRHIHRNFVFGGASPAALADFDDAYAALREELDELESLGIDGLNVPQPTRIRALAERYYAEFRPAAERAAEDPRGFEVASNIGLSRLAAMGNAAAEIDELGEQLAEESLLRVEQATRTEQVLLTWLVAGALAIGVTLAIAAGRVLARLRALYESEQHSRQELARALQTKTDFIADASHELRTPLAVILGNAETALASDDPAQQSRSLAAVAGEARRMGRLVDDLLFLARSDSGAPPLDREYLPARWLISRVTKPAAMLARQHGMELMVDADATGYLDADPGRIEQAVLILIDNAVRHSPPGGRIALSTRIEHGQFVIDVSDDGPGIPPEELPLIFDRFYQVRNRRSRKQGGSGLGLSIARSIVTAHHGSIAAESTPGHGTRMIVKLPLAPPPEATGEPETRPHPSAAGVSRRPLAR
jgi:two-component system, OmpR family, sensor histidine kinase VicK